MTATLEPAAPSAVIDRISLVLDAFDGPGRLTLAQIVRRTGLPRSSAHRMLERLVQLRWLRRSGRDYELGMRLVELGSLAVHQDRRGRAASPLLGQLHRATGLVVHLAALYGPGAHDSDGHLAQRRRRPAAGGADAAAAAPSAGPAVRVNPFSGGVAVITGAGAGIGAGIACRAGALGMTVVLADIDAGAIAALRDELRAAGG